MNNSSTGGILQPHPQPPPIDAVPAGLTLVQFLQILLVGMSALPATMVRPDWQPEPPKQPDLPINWLAFGVGSVTPDANAYQAVESGVVTLARQETLRIVISVYGPAAQENITLIRDGFQIPQNNASLKRANMGYVDISDARHIPDLVNERWIDRYVCELTLHRCIQREYPILDFTSATGTVYTQTAADRNFQLSWNAGA